ncbi:hypothetical protein CO083_01625 [Candidatus Roizmanbacteria bacterium CG_4_9_14_0_8_um_filter_34_12]|uniref:Penicillin-binding protein 2 n=4 Tax=Candidatus Roizmaniibacteriota TaxID=1752723 RepID=A0A2M7E4N1_9BACT|nr:penicillin-binding protein 2 [Candidatus Roizmanbacteria bacterium]PIP64545.1 MAG: hypothetical protein COW96_01900 [Candidatus Roizmanbacteria bacterium CG22_combo_CG10-13_8_21_14_all_33_16]PIV62676.1 MAG: hypothetical protein COS12_01485 [Candidatus Roizmanbacteria bacterium CG01_land_8_20_14_3_00_33_9]PIX70274.1 MAG: hypothetical protein COZ39_04695 [Candidatus Roizmanbacteria bacterium CG_4_10_14_3_um_filter_33_21]PJB88946.1 MAG: hypothetical protein CO083_01625 [Candidatus Roizmanbacter
MIKFRILFIGFLFVFLIIIIKLVSFQISSNSNYSNYFKTSKIFPKRGKIFDRNKQPLAVNQTLYRLAIEPQKIKDVNNFINELAPLLKIDHASLEAKIDRTKQWQLIKTTLSKETMSKVTQLKQTGIIFEEESNRYYPEASLAAHLIGFVGKNSENDPVGYFGVEGYYNKDLSGLPGLLRSERDLSNNPIFAGTQEMLEAEDGRDLFLTIDKAVQMIIKGRLKKAMKIYQVREGCVIVVDPLNLEVLGLSCLPDFDAEEYYKFDETFYKNSALTNLYEPGSTFKPLIVAAAIQEKAIKPNDIYNETGPLQFGEYQIQTWNNKYEGKISITRILEKSSNVGMVYIGEKLGNKKIYEYLNDYGFGKKTDIDLQGEFVNQIKPFNNWYPIDFATATFGQGIAVTPLQMIKAFASLINGGQLLQPHVVRQINNKGEVRNIQKKLVKKVLGTQTSNIIKKMLQSTVENGEISWAIPKGYLMGGKTGTAQVAIKGHYDPSKTIASFIGFAPVSNPKFLTLVILKEPKTSQWGSETAAPLFFEIAKDLIVYYNIAPEQ